VTDKIDVVCDGVLFATLEAADLPGKHPGHQVPRNKKSAAGDPDFPSGDKPKKRRRSKKAEVALDVE
jgi:hypothetical protein